MSLLLLFSGGEAASTGRTDCDGATIRTPVVRFLHAMDSVRNADLGGAHVLSYADRYATRSVRQGRGETEGRYARMLIQFGRAGEAAALNDLILWVSSKKETHGADDVTSRTDGDGATLTVPNVRFLHSGRSLRNADLDVGSTDQERHAVRFRVPEEGSKGPLHRMMFTFGRAGNACALKDLVLWVSSSSMDYGGKET